MGFRGRKIKNNVLSVALALLVWGCSQQPQSVGQGGSTNPGIPTSVGASGGAGSSTTIRGTTVDPLLSFKSYATTKVIFNKSNFFNNTSPNPGGCAGDARYFYDPQTDRKVPSK